MLLRVLYNLSVACFANCSTPGIIEVAGCPITIFTPRLLLSVLRSLMGLKVPLIFTWSKPESFALL